MTKTLRTILTALLALLMVLPACGAGFAEQADPGFEETLDILYVYGSATPPEEEGLYVEKYLEDKFNVNITYPYIDPQQKEQQLAVMFASGEVPDFLWVNDLATLTTYVDQGFIREIPLEKIQQLMPTYYQWTLEISENIFDYSNFDGKNYAFPKPNAAGHYVDPMVFRKDWLDKIGFEGTPTTLEDYEKVFYAFANEDPDGNGQKDTYALTAPGSAQNSGATNWFTPIFGAFGTIPGYYLEYEGKIVNGFEHPGYLPAVKLLAKWYADGVIDPEWLTDVGVDRTGGVGDIPTKFAEGRIGFLYDMSATEYKWSEERVDRVSAEIMSVWQAHNDWQNQTFETAWVMGDAPKGEMGQGTSKIGAVGEFAAIGALTDDAKMERILKMFEAITTDPETYVATLCGQEGVHHELEDCPASPTGKTAYWTDEFQAELNGEAEKNLSKIGTSSFFNPFFHWSDHIKFYYAGNILAERQELSDLYAKGPGYENLVKVKLPSEADYPDLPKVVDEFTMNAISGRFEDIDAEYQKTWEVWKSNGGDILSQEANELLNK